MSEPFNYNSIYAPYFRSFIKMKQDLGINVLRTKWILLEFDKFFVGVGAQDLYIRQHRLISGVKPALMMDSVLYTRSIPSGHSFVNTCVISAMSVIFPGSLKP